MNTVIDNNDTTKKPGELIDEDIVLSVDNIARAYGQTKALKACSFSVRRGEIHALIGENGAGKSTLLKILSGIIPPDSGYLTIENVQHTNLVKPSRAQELGIGTSFQEILTIPEMSVLENVWLGSDPSLIWALPKQQRKQRAKEVLGELLGEEAPLNLPISQLEISRQQLCVIARALLKNPKIALLDEPTAALDIADRERLFKVIRRMADENGTAFIFISHRMDEIMEIADRVTVLRAGESVATLDRNEITPAALIELMSGSVVAQKDRAVSAKDGKISLRITDLQLKTDRPTFSLEARSGEIIGVAGLEGHGQDQFIKMLVGLMKPIKGRITIETNTGPKEYRSLDEAAKLGVVYVPRERKTEGIFDILSIMDNFALPAISRYSKGLFLNRKQMDDDFDNYKEKLSFVMSHKEAPISTLSGGNQQKILIARWLNMNPNIIIFNDPTRGVDPRTKTDIYQIASDLAAKGATVVFLSTDVEELIHLVDRVWVFREGTLETEIPYEKLTSNALVAAFFGHKGTIQEGQI